ncbi:hypothetical protein NicSoilB8_18100 [Arthrobacter sp. NicSoilB8]|nr:hypothetical protein NicSoilB8_18100 [Arthrobacter sp. NicSoilB8]
MSLTDAQLTELYDKQALHDNLMLYARGADRHDRELMKSTYWPDVESHDLMDISVSGHRGQCVSGHRGHSGRFCSDHEQNAARYQDPALGGDMA